MTALLLLLAAAGFEIDPAFDVAGVDDAELWHSDAIALYVPVNARTVELGDALGRSAGSLPADRAVAFLQTADLDDAAATFTAWEALAA